MAALMRSLSSVCFLCLFSSILSSAPNVFEDYFNEDVKDVAISENIALKACLESPNDLIDKISYAKRECFNGDSEFDWNDFADLNGKGNDPDNNGMSSKMEDAEMCFYKELGWTDGDKVLRAEIFADFASIPDGGIKTIFRDDVMECYEWDGDFASRKRRSIEEELGEAADDSFAMVPLIRQRRQAVRRPVKGAAPKKGPAKKVPMKKGPAKKGPVRKAPLGKKGPAKTVRGKKGPAGKAGGKFKGGKKGGKGKGPGPKGVKNGQQNVSSIDKGVYNSLWCVDLAVQKYLQTCVENTLTNGESWNN